MITILPPVEDLNDEVSSEFLADTKSRQKDALRIAKEVVESCKVFNYVWKRHNLHGELDYSQLENMIKSKNFIGWQDHILPIAQGKFKGVMTEEHILTIAEIAANYFHHKSKDNIVVWGPCQGAKTMVFCGSIILLPVIEQVVYKSICVPVVHTPNKKNMAISTRKELEGVLNLYSPVYFRHKNYSVPLSYVRDVIVDKHLQSPDGATKSLDDLVLQRNRANIANFCSMGVKEKKRVTTTVFIDELHHGSAMQSIQEEMYEEFIRANPGIRLRQIGVTATPAEVFSRTDWSIVRMWVPDNYLGVTSYNGHYLPTLSGKQPAKPTILAIEDEFPNEHQFEDTKLFEKQTYFEEVRGLKRNQGASQHAIHRRQFAEWIADIYTKKVDDTYPIFFLRPFRRVEDCRILYHHLEDILQQRGLNDEYRLLQYFGSLPEIFGRGARQRTVREVLIDNFIRPGRKCLVIMTDGRASMGDSFPKECRHFMDLFEDRTYWDTRIQSTLGRSMGFDKKSICYFRRTYCNWLTRFMNNDGKVLDRQFNSRTNYDPNIRKNRGRPGQSRIYIFPDA